MAASGNMKMSDMGQAFGESEKEGLSGKKLGQPAINPYQYQHRVSLDDKSLTKLGFGSKLPKIGDQFMVHALGEVHSVTQHSSATSGSGTNSSMPAAHSPVP